MEKMRRLLETVGIGTFINYFHIFEANKEFRSNQEIKEAFKANNENWNDASMNTKASCGKAIFTNRLVFNALTYICNEANHIQDEVRQKAKELLSNQSVTDFEIQDTEGKLIFLNPRRTKVNILARELMSWILDQEDFASEINLTKVNTKNASENKVASYKWSDIGKGTFIKVFKQEPTEDELRSGNSIRFFTESINAEFLPEYDSNLHYFLTNQWSSNDNFYSLERLIDFANKHASGKYELKYTDQSLEIFESDYEDQEEDIETQELEELDKERTERIDNIIDNINYYRYDKNIPKRKIIDYDQLVKRFVARLCTQNRKYASGIYYYPTVFLGIKELNYIEYIQKQIDDIHVYANNERTKLNEFGFIRFQDGKLYGIKKDESRYSKNLIELFFSLNKAENIHSFENLFRKESDLSLGHLTSMYNILHNRCKLEIPQLLKISKEMNRLDLDYKTKEGLEAIRNYMKKDAICLKSLKKELDLIHKNTEIDLVPKRINSAVGRY